MKDPVTGFEYPEAWVKKCSSPDLLRLAEEGLAVLTSSGTVIRRGYTTGTTAAAACKAAILSLSGVVTSVAVHLPCGLDVSVPVFGLAGNASCKKFAGDYPDDVTAGCEFIAEATPYRKGSGLFRGWGSGGFHAIPPASGKENPLSVLLRWNVSSPRYRKQSISRDFQVYGSSSRSRLGLRLPKKRSIPG